MENFNSIFLSLYLIFGCVGKPTNAPNHGLSSLTFDHLEFLDTKFYRQGDSSKFSYSKVFLVNGYNWDKKNREQIDSFVCTFIKLNPLDEQTTVLYFLAENENTNRVKLLKHKRSFYYSLNFDLIASYDFHSKVLSEVTYHMRSEGGNDPILYKFENPKQLPSCLQ